ncbi:hypothetical protein [Lysobacter gummosus]|uniref:hypothetical protein n=1 Tax=Lysobacter gummosus TaxID=262324 RepID=UPI003636FE6E
MLRHDGPPSCPSVPARSAERTVPDLASRAARHPADTLPSSAPAGHGRATDDTARAVRRRRRVRVLRTVHPRPGVMP